MFYSSNLIGSFNLPFFLNLRAKSFLGECPIKNAVNGHLLSES